MASPLHVADELTVVVLVHREVLALPLALWVTNAQPVVTEVLGCKVDPEPTHAVDLADALTDVTRFAAVLRRTVVCSCRTNGREHRHSGDHRRHPSQSAHFHRCLLRVKRNLEPQVSHYAGRRTPPYEDSLG